MQKLSIDSFFFTGDILKRKIFYIFAVFVLVFSAVILYSNDFTTIYNLPNEFCANLEELEKSNKDFRFGKNISLQIDEETKTSDKKYKERVVVFKLFGFIPVRKIVAKILPEEEVFVGGNPIGISLTFDKAIVVSKSDFGMEINRNVLKEGDVICKVDGKDIFSLENLSKCIENSSKEEIEIEYIRNNKPHKSLVKLYQNDNGEKKIGLTVKDGVSGIGTLTYINSQTGEFGALGHELCDNCEAMKIVDGDVYDCTMLGIEKGKANDPGQLRCVFVSGENEKGEVDFCNRFGVFGNVLNYEDIVDTNLKYKLGGRLSVSPGKAKIVSSVSGIREEYDIEIIKTYAQNDKEDKSFIFKVTDERLLSLTGGIVQGMSGSPIIQNGKIIGAVTHVFTVDPTKGYGVYTDWMICDC